MCHKRTSMAASSLASKPLNPFAKAFIPNPNYKMAPELAVPVMPMLPHLLFPPESMVGNVSMKVNVFVQQNPAKRVSDFYSRYHGRALKPPRLRLTCTRMPQVRGKVPEFQWRPKKPISHAPSSSPPPLVAPPVADEEGLNKTSVMIRNIPNQYSRDELLEFLDTYCKQHHLEYDFAYLPIDFRKGFNKGYAFVNFTTPSAANKLEQVLQGYKWRCFKTKEGNVYTSRKVCEITWAKIQGKDGLVRHFKNSRFPCNTEDYLPVEFNPPRNGAEGGVSMTTIGNFLGSM